MFAYVLALLFSVQVNGPAVQQDEVKDALAHAEALYYEARFKDSIQLLTRVDELLRGKTDRPQDRINAKVQLALAYIGLNDNDQAKAFFREVYSLDANYILDANQFSPKIISLANEAKGEAGELRCLNAREDARKKLEAGNAMAAMTVIGSMKSQCRDLAAFEPATADLLYRSGLDSYKRADYRDAVQKFKSATTWIPSTNWRRNTMSSRKASYRSRPTSCSSRGGATMRRGNSRRPQPTIGSSKLRLTAATRKQWRRYRPSIDER